MALKILYLAAEAEPFIKVGGLGDVAGSLPVEIKRLSTEKLSVDIRLAIPFHGVLRKKSLPVKFVSVFSLPHFPEPVQAQVYQLEHKGLIVYFIGGTLIRPENPIYSADARLDGAKYTFFSLAALELVKELQWAPDVIHANDWHTAPALYALKLREDPFFNRTTRFITIHNLPYLGHEAGQGLSEFNLPPALDSPLPGWAQNTPLPLGLISADCITTVSPTYAQEILTPDFGAGLQDYLLSRQEDIHGILNGLDLEKWDPALDAAIPTSYDLRHLNQKASNRAALLAELNLDPTDPALLIGMVSRLDYQKGVDLVCGALTQMAHLPWRAVILGTGSPDLIEAVSHLQGEFPERVRAILRYDADLSHRIYAGVDVLLIPSRYEPCGLTQMIAMRYGTIPIGRSTGGLKDTIQDPMDSAQPTGFLFEDASPASLAVAIQRALEVFPDKKRWTSMQQQAMCQDHSWKRAARQYLDIYLKYVNEKIHITQPREEVS